MPSTTQYRGAARRQHEKVLSIIGPPQRAAYGSAEIEKLDIYKTRRPNAPIIAYIHGGACVAAARPRNAYIAEPFVKAGAHLSPSKEVAGGLDHIV